MCLLQVTHLKKSDPDLAHLLYVGEWHYYDFEHDNGRNLSDWGSVAESQGREREKLKSGFLDKPKSQVLVKLLWLHMNQNPRYVTSSLTFNQLNFCQFVGGECRTILKTTSEEEVLGRLKILSKVEYLFDQCKD